MKRSSFLKGLLAVPAALKAAALVEKEVRDGKPDASFVGDGLDHPPAISSVRWKIIDLGPTWGKCKFHYSESLDKKK